MPERYLKIKAAQKKKGKSDKAAKTSAARIFNATRKPNERPVTGKHKGPKKRTRT